MPRVIGCCLLFAVLSGAAYPGDPAAGRLPVQSSPQLGVAVVDSHSGLTLITRTCHEVEEEIEEKLPVKETKTVNGQKTEATTIRSVRQTRLRLIRETTSERFEKEKYWVSRDGKRLDDKSIVETLAKDAPVVVVRGDYLPESLDPFYQDFFKAGTVVVGVGSKPRPPASAGTVLPPTSAPATTAPALGQPTTPPPEKKP